MHQTCTLYALLYRTYCAIIITVRKMYIEYNPNPQGKNCGDCAVRAISKAFNIDWGKAYSLLASYGMALCDMPTANVVWGEVLKSRGFIRQMIPDELLGRYTVQDFCEEFSQGIYILALSSHVVCVIDGDLYDSWDSSKEMPLYYWQRKE